MLQGQEKESSGSSNDDFCQIDDTEYKVRLFLGEGDFNHTVVLLKKHSKLRGLAKHITPTEYAKEQALLESYPQYKKNKQFLESKGVEPLFEVDARKPKEQPKLKDRYHRIHWVCPHDRSSLLTRQLFKLLGGFFKGCGELQLYGDIIKVVLPKPPEQKKDWYDAWYNIIEAAARHQYMLIAPMRAFHSKRRGTSRYPGYLHKMTARPGEEVKKVAIADELREWAFQKVNLDDRSIHKCLGVQKKLLKVGSMTVPYIPTPQAKTDPESSDYFLPKLEHEITEIKSKEQANDFYKYIQKDASLFNHRGHSVSEEVASVPSFL